MAGAEQSADDAAAARGRSDDAVSSRPVPDPAAAAGYHSTGTDPAGVGSTGAGSTAGDAGTRAVTGSSAAAPDPGTLSSATVVDVRGRRLGRVHDVFRVDRTGEVAALSVAIGRWGGRIVLVAADRLSPAGSGRLVLDPSAGPLEDAPEAPVTGHLTGEELAALGDGACTSGVLGDGAVRDGVLKGAGTGR